MKKVTSFLLALVMVFSLLPGTTVPVSAAGEESTVPTQNNGYSQVVVNKRIGDLIVNAGTGADEHYTTNSNLYTVRFRTGTMTAEGTQKEVAAAYFGQNKNGTLDTNRGFEVSFEATFNDLVILDPAATASEAAKAGFSVDVGGVDRYGFHADAAGNVYITRYDEGEPVRFDTGANLGDKYVNVRIVADDQRNATVTVDGNYVGRFATPQVNGVAGDRIALYTGTMYRSGNTHVNDVTVYNYVKLAQVPVVEELQAYYTFDEPYLDGRFDEFNWAFDNNNKFALLSDEEYLYIALQNTDPDPDFVINGVSLTADFETGSVTAGGKWAGEVVKGNHAEIKIPLKSVLGLDYAPGQKVAFTYAWDEFDGAIVMAARALIAHEGFEPLKSGMGSESDEVYAEQDGDGTIRLKTGVYSKGGNQDLHHKNIDSSRMDFYKGMDFEFTADFTDLVVPVVPVLDEGYTWTDWDDKWLNETSPFNWYAAGFGLEVRSDPCHRYGFHADAEGNIYVTQRMADYSQVTRVDTGINVGDTNVNVRLSADAAGATTIYVNGVACAEKLPASTFECPKTGGRGYYQFQNSTNYRDTATSRVNDVTLYNLALYQDVPLPVAGEHPKSDSANVDITAYLMPDGIKPDGVLNEAQWYTPYAVSGTDATPGGLVGIGWGDGNLYVGVDSKAELARLTLGGRRVVANPRPYQTPKSGELFVGNNAFEWIIPLSEFGLNNGVMGERISYEIALENNLEEEQAVLKGNLYFSAEQMLLGETGRNYSGTDYFLSSTTGHIHWDRTDNGVALTAEGLNELNPNNGSFYATGTFMQEHNIPVDYTSGAFDLTMTATINDLPNVVDTFGMRGLVFEMVGENIRAVFALYKNIQGDILMTVRDELDEKTHETGVKVGSGKPIEFRFAMDDQKSITLYVNGESVYAFAPIDRRDVTATAVALTVPHFMIGAYNSGRGLNADGTVSVVDAVIHDLRLTKTPYPDSDAVVQAALEQINEADILNGGNSGDVTELALPDRIYVDNVGEPVPVKWNAIDKLTGRTAYHVDIENGLVERAEETRGFDLKATVSYNDAVGSKTFSFQTMGNNIGDSMVTLIENDDAPASGAVTAWYGERYAYLDTTHNSIVVNQGESRTFNRIVLRDSDEHSRVSQRHLGVFISDDGENWDKVTGWMLHQSGRTYTLYNLNATAQYVKVHCYHDDMDLAEGPTFYNKVSEMIKVSKESSMPGIHGKLKYTATFQAANDTETEKKDTPVYVSLETLGATSNQYKTNCADFRFTIDETVLPHWYNGVDGFYVRIPSIPANSKVGVTAHWGCNLAEDFSDGEATFEVTYGNVSLINLSKQTYDSCNGDLEQAMLSHGRPFTFPNGDIIVVARTMKAASNEAVYRSTDGGYTFKYDGMAYRDGEHISAVAYNGQTYRSSGFGGFLWDDSEHLKTKDENGKVIYEGRLFMITYSGQGGNNTDYRLVLNYTDDYGATWSDPVFLSVPGASDIIDKATGESVVSWLQDPNNVRNTGTEVAKRAILYGEGLKMKDADGDGGNVDYVIVHADTVYSCPTGNVNDVTDGTMGLRNVTTAIYSKDGGKTWICSDSMMELPGVDPSRNQEDGMSEFGFAQLDDGTLRTVMRAQSVDNYYQYEGISKDFGKTWTAKSSGVLSSNTSPVLTKLGNDRLEMWSACTGLGQASYRRTPMHLGLSTNQYESFDKIIDLTFATAFDSVQNMQGRKAQPGIGIHTDKETGKTSAFVCYYDQTWHLNPTAWRVDEGKFMEKGGTMGFAIEEFDQMVYGTKGAWDDFEDSSLKYQGWLVDTHGTIELSREQAVSGTHSMKVMDKTSGGVAHALRQIPSLKSGTVGAKLMVPATNQAPFVMELKAAYNYEHMLFTVAAIFVTPSGSVGYVDANKTQHILATVEAGSWNDYALSFDVETGKGTLYVNGDEVGVFDLPDTTASGAEMHGATVVQFNQAGATKQNGDCLYVDDFFANELTNVSRTLEDTSANQTTLGRFMTIVRKILEIDGEMVELVEWGWVPGL